MKVVSLLAFLIVAFLVLTSPHYFSSSHEASSTTSTSTPTPTTPSPECPNQVQTACAAKEIECRAQCDVSPFVWQCTSVDNFVTSCSVASGCSCTGCSVFAPTTPQLVSGSGSKTTSFIASISVIVVGVLILLI